MGKIISLIHISLDGYMAGPGGEIDWVIMDPELSDYVAEQWRGAAGTIYGRTTYQIMENYWPGVLKNPENFPQWQLDYARWVDSAVKVVVSRTLSKVGWNNTRLVSDDAGEAIRRIKQEIKGDLLLLASATLAEMLSRVGLIDEWVVTVNPIILGGGIPFFKGLPDKKRLELLETRTFKSGVVGLRYATRI